MGLFTVNKDMLPMKGHYFFFNAGTAPLVPYLPTYAKQLGFSSYIVGIIYTFLPIFGLIAKPVFGAIGDRFEKHKFIFILFQVFTILGFSGLYFIQEVPQQPEVHLSCGNGETFFDVCAVNGSSINDCSANKILSLNDSMKCNLSCSMTSPLMWQTVCEDWNISKYCSTPLYHLDTQLDYYDIELDEQSHKFIQNNIFIYNVTNDLKCSRMFRFPMSAKCSQICDDEIINELSESQYLMCNENLSQLNIIPKSKSDLQKQILLNRKDHKKCNIHCVQTKQHFISCSSSSDNKITCRTALANLPETLSFTGLTPLGKTLQEDQCIYFKLSDVILDDGSSHKPYCSKELTSHEHFHSQCKIDCNNVEINEFISTTSSSNILTESSQHSQLWIFFSLMALNWIGMAVVVSIADAICFEKLGENPEKFGQQRLWGSAGWGIFSLLTGYLIDTFSQNHSAKNYLVAFILMMIFLLCDIVVSFKLKYKQNKISVNLLHKVGLLFRNRRICHFFVWIVLVGMCTGLLWQFLFWYLEDLATAFDCNTQQSGWIKTLQGFVSGIQCFLGEIPFLFFSGHILKKIGHLHAMSLVLLGFGIRFVLYSVLTNPWWVLPIELLQGLTFGILYANMASYASVIAPEGTEATLQGLVGAVFEGVGASLGSLIGGFVYGKLGGAMTFRIYGCVALVACVLNVILSYFFAEVKNKSPRQPQQEFTSIIHYAAPNDAIDLLNDY